MASVPPVMVPTPVAPGMLVGALRWWRTARNGYRDGRAVRQVSAGPRVEPYHIALTYVWRPHVGNAADCAVGGDDGVLNALEAHVVT
jgi:hypothetical protein